MKLFGKELFGHSKLLNKTELYDFAKHGLIRESANFVSVGDINMMAVSGDDEQSREYLNGVEKNNKKAKENAKKKQYTPKEVYKLESLNDTTYVINTDEQYIHKHVTSLSKKLNLLPPPKYKKKDDSGPFAITESYGSSRFSYEEVNSLIERLENRRHYAEHEAFFNEFPYTTSELINNVINDYPNLRAKRVEEFIPDLPDEAIDKMQSYTDVVREVCNKNPVFYIIADKKDFGEVDKKRDPILLAQSPFALSWQVLGAWDDEMIYLGDL